MSDTPIAAVYDELRAMAQHRLATDPAGNSLDATALVHEAYLKLHGKVAWESDRHYFHAAAQAMRRILVAAPARRKRTSAVATGQVPTCPMLRPPVRRTSWPWTTP